MKAEPLEYDTDKELDRAELAERHLHDFVRVSWPVLHPTERFVDGWHIEAMAEHLEALVAGDINKLIVNVAVKMTKSMVASVMLPAWTWIRWPSSTWLYFSHSIKLASEHSVSCRRLVESRWYRAHWGDRFVLTSDQNEKMRFDNDQRGSRAAFGMTGSTGHGGLFSVVDDPHDREDWKHPNEIKRAVGSFDADIYNAVSDPTNCRRLVICQRVSDIDLSGHLMRQGGWETLTIPTEYDPKRSKVTVLGWKDPRKKEGELACPLRWNRAEVEIVKRNRRLFSAFHQQDPSIDEGAIFKRPNWRYYAEDPHDIADKMDIVIQSWDLTTGGPNPGTSKVAGQVWGKAGANKYLLDRVLAYMDMTMTLKAIRTMTRLWPQARAKVIELAAAGPGVIALLRDEIPGIISWPPKGEKLEGKVTRAQIVQPDHEARNLILPDPNRFSWVQEFVEFCAAFPNGEFDDDIDAMTQAVTRLNRTPSSASGPEGVGHVKGWL